MKTPIPSAPSLHSSLPLSLSFIRQIHTHTHTFTQTEDDGEGGEVKRVPFEAYEAITYEEGVEAEEDEEEDGEGYDDDEYSSDEESEEQGQKGLWKGGEEDKDEKERQQRSASEGRGREGGRGAAITESEKVPMVEGVTGAGGGGR